MYNSDLDYLSIYVFQDDESTSRSKRMRYYANIRLHGDPHWRSLYLVWHELSTVYCILPFI